MTQYRFSAFLEDGQLFTSKVEAHSLQEAKEKIDQKGYYCHRIRRELFSFQKPIKKKDVFLFTQELHRLLKSNLTLIESLELLKDQSFSFSFSNLIDSIYQDLKQGLTLSVSLAKHPKIFNTFYTQRVQAAEQSGSLSLIFGQILLELKRQIEVKKKLTQALTYPLFLTFFCILLFNVLFLYLVPQLETLFDAEKLQGLTKFLVSISHHYQKTFYLYAFLGLSLVFMVYRGLKSERIRETLTTFSLQNKWIQKWSTPFYYYRFCSSLHFLLKADVSLSESLYLTESLFKKGVFQDLIRDCQKDLREGCAFYQSLKKKKWVPSLLISLVHIGEKSGQLTSSFEELSKMYEEKAMSQLNQLLSLLSPLLLFMMAALIGLLALGILGPLTDFQLFSESL